jgi:hypothetical protein
MHEWLSSDFVTQVGNTLAGLGFVTNEHIFTPYGDTICKNIGEIQKALSSQGNMVEIQAGSLSSVFGTIYYIFDSEKISPAIIKETVLDWVNSEYRFDEDDDEIAA